MKSSYERWNSWLLERSFPAGRPGASVYLEVHESLLEEGAEELGLRGSGSELFIEAVLTLGHGNAENVFPGLAGLAKSWRNGAGPPPFVAGLGFAVLAASEMRTDPGKRATAANYYYRLNQLLGLRRKGQPAGFETTWAMWRELRDWLSANRRGDLVVRGLHGTRKYVDPVKSQCLVRTCDLAEFGGLLRRIQCVPGREIDPEDVVPFLSRWLRGQGSTSRLAGILGRDPPAEMLYLAAEALADRIEVWGTDAEGDAESETRASRATLQAEPHPHPSLRWKSARWAVAVFAEVATEHQSVPLSISGKPYEAELDYFEPPRFVCSVSLDSVADILGANAQIVVSGAEAEIPFDTPLWLEVPAGSTRPDTWEPTNSLNAGLQYQVVFREQEFDRLAAAYGNMLEEGYEILAGSSDQWPGPGLFALCSARIARGDDLPESIGFSSTRERLRLSGGLRVARRTYLRFALPRVEGQLATPVSILGEDGNTLAQVHGQNLNELDLEEGMYTVRSGAAKATFAVTSPRWGEVRSPEGRHTTSNWQASLGQGHSRGALIQGASQLHVLQLEPGRKLTVYSPECRKFNVPPEGGIVEVLYTGELACVMRGSQPAEAPLPLHEVFSAASDVATGEADGGDQEAADRLLHFISARASGPVERLRAICQGLAEDGEPWHRVLQLYEALGHVDVDWDTRRWFAAPPVLCRRSSNPTEYFAAGVRTLDYQEAVLTGLMLAEQDSGGGGRHIAPRLLLYGGEQAVIGRQCQEAGINIPEEPPADSLLVRLRSISESDWWLGPSFWPPRDADRFEIWEPSRLRWIPAHPENLLGQDSDSRLLVRWQDVGLTRIVLIGGSTSWLVKDPSAAKWFLAPRDVSLVQYAEKERFVQMPRAMGLPRPYLRASVLAAGLPPRAAYGLDVYDHFSLRAARLLAVRLQQQRAPGLW